MQRNIKTRGHAQLPTVQAEMRLSIIIPAYNEELNIRDVVSEMLAGIPSAVRDYELILVDDGSTDRTRDLLKELAAGCNKIRIIRHDVNLGYGAALRSGFKNARMEWIFFTDADMQINISELPQFLPVADGYDMLIGFRTGRQDSIARRLLSKGYGRLIAAALGVNVRDINCPFKLFRKQIIDSVDLFSQGFLINAELLYKACQKSFQIVELGVVYRGRQRGSSKVRFRHVIETVRELASLLRAR